MNRNNMTCFSLLLIDRCKRQAREAEASAVSFWLRVEFDYRYPNFMEDISITMMDKLWSEVG